MSVCLSRSDTLISSTGFIGALSRSPQSATNGVERRISSRSVAASNSVATTRRYRKTDHHARTAVTLNFELEHKCPTKSLFTKLVRFLLSFVGYLVVHVFPARMREIVYSELLTASVEGSFVTTVILTDGADARRIFYTFTRMMLGSSVNVV